MGAAGVPQEPSAGADAGRLLELIGGSWATQVVRTAADLGLADALAGEPATVADLAVTIGADPAALSRLLRALCALELSEEVEPGHFAMTQTGNLLRAGDGSLAPWAKWWGGPAWTEWGALPEVVRTGRSARASNGDVGFDRLRADPGLAELFDAAMAALTRLDAPAIVDALQLDGSEVVADVGGGRGELLAAVLDRHRQASGMVIDLPSAREGAEACFAERGLTGRAAVVAADIFEHVPGGADVYLLKSVLHDWDDAEAQQILARCRAALGPGGRLCLVERIMFEHIDGSAVARSTARMDLHMLVAQGGRERTEAAWRTLLAASGFEVTDIRPTSATSALIDASVVGGGAQRSA